MYSTMQSVLFPQMDVWSHNRVGRISNGSPKARRAAVRTACQALHEPPIRRREKCVSLHKPLSWMSLEKDSPEGRSVQPPESGPVVAVSQVGGRHHRYECRAA
jgi:hypothetical protein